MMRNHLVTWWKRLGISAIKTGQDHPSWLWCTWRLSFLGGLIVLQCFVHLRSHSQPLPTKLVFGCFDRGSYGYSAKGRTVWYSVWAKIVDRYTPKWSHYVVNGMYSRLWTTLTGQGDILDLIGSPSIEQVNSTPCLRAIATKSWCSELYDWDLRTKLRRLNSHLLSEILAPLLRRFAGRPLCKIWAAARLSLI